MNHKSRIGLMMALALSLSPLAACESGADSDKLTFKPGLVASLTGGLSAFGKTYSDVSRLAVEDLQAAVKEAGYDDEFSVELAGIEDDQTDAAAAVEAANKLVAEGATVIVGSLSSTATLAIANSVTIPKSILQVSPAATSPALSSVDDNNLLWRTVPPDSKTAEVLAGQLVDELGSDATVNIGVRNDPFGLGFHDAFISAWESSGGTIGADVKWDPNGASFDAEAQELVAGDPDAFVVIDFPETFAKVGPALVRTGKWSPSATYTNQGLESTDLADIVGEEASEGLTGLGQATTGEAAAQLEQRYKSDNPDAPWDSFAANSYDAVIIPFLAQILAGSNDPTKIAAKMQDVTQAGATVYTNDQLVEAIEAVANGESIDYQGAAGAMHLDANGDPAGGSFQGWIVKDGAIKVTETFTTES